MKLEHHLLRANIIQMMAIAVATLLGVLVTATIMEHLLLRTALSGEADFYWQSKAVDQNHALPSTLNMRGYLEVAGNSEVTVPDYLQAKQPGYHTKEINGVNKLIHVSENNGEKLFLIINEEQITELSFFFGVVPLMISLAGLYLLSWLTQRTFLSTMSPIAQLAEQLENVDTSKKAFVTIPDRIHFKDTEIMTLFQETQKLLDRVYDSVDREKRFSRDASHELRTPLAVMKGSLEIIQRSKDQASINPKIERALARAQRSGDEMSRLIEELLLLAREDYQQVTPELVYCNELIDHVADEIRTAFSHSSVELVVDHQTQWTINAPLSVLRVVLMNIATNAMRYTSTGKVTLATWDHTFQITDTGEGFDAEFLQHAFQPFSRGHHENTKGFGLGLSIVKRFCDHYGWSVAVNSERGKGSEFTVTLVDSDEGQVNS